MPEYAAIITVRPQPGADDAQVFEVAIESLTLKDTRLRTVRAPSPTEALHVALDAWGIPLAQWYPNSDRPKPESNYQQAMRRGGMEG